MGCQLPSSENASDEQLTRWLAPATEPPFGALGPPCEAENLSTSLLALERRRALLLRAHEHVLNARELVVRAAAGTDVRELAETLERQTHRLDNLMLGLVARLDGLDNATGQDGASAR